MERCEILCIRAEELVRLNDQRERYDVAVTRALANPAVAFELVLPFVKIGGKALFWASGIDWDKKEELEKIAAILGAKYSSEINYILSENEKQAERKIVVLEKINPTDLRFPRRTGIPQKRPLL